MGFLARISGSHWVAGIGVLVTLLGAPSTAYWYYEHMSSVTPSAANASTAIDPQKELASKGLGWNSKDFEETLRRKDIPNLKLYLAGGMTLTPTRFRMLFYKSFDGRQAFDPAVANLITDRNALPHDVCPVPEIVNSPDIPLFTKGAYAGGAYALIHLPDLYEDAESSDDELKFIKRICNQPAIMASIDNVAAISKQQSRYIPEVKTDIGRWRHIRKLLSGVEPSW
jgi:hypothetical protein